MTEMLRELQMKIKSSTGAGQKTLLLEYLAQIIALKNNEEFTEEEVGYRIVSLFFSCELDTAGEYRALFDAAVTLEHPRESSYVQPLGHWDEKKADAIKVKEWDALVREVEALK